VWFRLRATPSPPPPPPPPQEILRAPIRDTVDGEKKNKTRHVRTLSVDIVGVD
jgi:hypothetical protein